MYCRACVMKVAFVLEVARNDDRFFNDLVSNPYRTLQESGIDLTTSETFAILDVINDTSLSTLAPFLAKTRKMWKATCGEAASQVMADVALQAAYQQTAPLSAD